MKRKFKLSLLTVTLLSPVLVKAETISGLGTRIEQLYDNKDLPGLRDTWDTDRFFDRISQNVNTDAAFKQDFKLGMGAVTDALYGRLLQEQGVTGSYKFLHLVKRANEERMLFRVVSGQGMLNYHEVIVDTSKPDAPKIVDMHILITGESLSQTMRRFFMIGAMGKEAEKNDLLISFQSIQNAAKAGEHQKVLDLFDALPPTLKKERMLSIYRLKSAMNVSDEVYEKVLTEHQGNFGKDLTADLMAIDLYTIKKEWKKTLEVIDRLDQGLGGDPYLKVLRANIYAMAGERSKIVPLAEKALKEEPTLIPAADIILTDTLSRRDHPETLKIMLQMERTMRYRFGDYSKLDLFADFAKSQQAKEFEAERPK